MAEKSPESWVQKKLQDAIQTYGQLEDLTELSSDKIRDLNQILIRDDVGVTAETVRLASLVARYYESEAEAKSGHLGKGVGVPYPKFAEAAGDRSKANRLKAKYNLKSNCEQKQN